MTTRINAKKGETIDRRRQRGEATRDHILDTAENLFAERGFDGVSIRNIAEAAEVSLMLINFHGGTKQEMFETILRRRADALTDARRDALMLLRASGKTPDVTALTEAYLRPVLDRAIHGGRQWRAYIRLTGRLVVEDRWQYLLHELFNPCARLYIDAVIAAVPGADERAVAAALVMSVASMTAIIVQEPRVASLMDGKAVQSVTPPLDVLVRFCAAGIERAARATG